MSMNEALSILLGLVAGYWVVSRLIRAKASDAPRQPPADNERESPGNPFETPAQSKAWNTVLGVAADATVFEIRAAYRQQMSQYHPDKVASLGVELRMFAEHKAKEITSAYRRALHEHDAVE